MNAKKALINQIGRKNKKQAEEPQPSVEKHKVFTHLPYFSPSLSSLLRVPTPIPCTSIDCLQEQATRADSWL